MISTGANDRSGLQFPVLAGFSLEHFVSQSRLPTDAPVRRAGLLLGEHLRCILGKRLAGF
jgi:hypothetical protein